MDGDHRILIVGAGRIGQATGLFLREYADFTVDILIGDSSFEKARQAADWILEGSRGRRAVTPFEIPISGMNNTFLEALARSEVLLDCLPADQALRMAQLALDNNLHYINVTEDLSAFRSIRQATLEKPPEKGFILQTGVAPGFVTILAHSLFQKFCHQYGVKSVENVSMKTGAINANAKAPHYYGFTWNPHGVALEYVRPAYVIRDGKPTEMPALSERAMVVIDEMIYEEALTAGGSADLPEWLENKARNLDYKTLRHPGHFDWVVSVLEQAPDGVDRADYLHQAMLKAVPIVNKDLVVLYASVEGVGSNGDLHRMEESARIYPCRCGKWILTAVQATMAAAVAEAVRLVLRLGYSGRYQQSEINPDTFLEGPFVQKIYQFSEPRKIDA